MDNKYFLAIETKPNNYFPIDLQNIKSIKNTTNLEELDRETLKYTKFEILNFIKEANLLEIDFNMPLIIIHYEKKKPRKLNTLTKDITFNMWQNIKENYENKNYTNKILNFLRNIIPASNYENLKKSSNLNEFLYNISLLDYINQRKLFFYLYE